MSGLYVSCDSAVMVCSVMKLSLVIFLKKIHIFENLNLVFNCQLKVFVHFNFVLIFLTLNNAARSLLKLLTHFKKSHNFALDTV